jgi:galactokinase
VAKRAQHVLEENQRVLDLQDAFGRRDVKAISQLMAESHRSMRDLFEITTPEIDLLVEIISGCIGEQGGVRMTGGGFGGCVVSLMPESLLCEVTNMISGTYFRATGLHASIYLTRPADGVTVLY